MGKIAAYEGYFKDIATKYKPIGHTKDEPKFWPMSQAAIMGKVRSKMNLNDWNLILLQPEPSVRTNNSRRYMFWTLAGFEVIKNVTRDDVSKNVVQDEALDYCREIVAKMMNEHKESVFGLGSLEESSLDFYLIDQEFDNAVGCGVSFQYHEGFSRTEIYNEDNWSL
jgi:hypothetical protein